MITTLVDNFCMVVLSFIYVHLLLHVKQINGGDSNLLSMSSVSDKSMIDIEYFRSYKYFGLQRPNEICKAVPWKALVRDDAHKVLEKMLNFGACKIVVGNLIIFNIKRRQNAFRYLQNIEVITGYLAIWYSDPVRFPKLRIVLGFGTGYRPLDYKEKVTLYVGNLRCKIGDVVDFRSLILIKYGHVRIEGDNCTQYITNRINWARLFSDVWRQDMTRSVDELTQNVTCDRSCSNVGNGQNFCWGKEAHLCQINHHCTHKQCSSDYCFRRLSKLSEFCCHHQCVGGCVGPGNNQCFSCRKFWYNGSCVDNCGKGNLLGYGPMCVDKCPPAFFQERGNCVAKCRDGYLPAQNGKCEACSTAKCRRIRICKVKKGKYITREMLPEISGCVVIKGDLKILFPSNVSFQELAPLKSIRMVTGNVIIQFQSYNNLSFLDKLLFVRGFLSIAKNSNLESLQLNSLIRVGKVLFHENAKLRYGISPRLWNIVANGHLYPKPEGEVVSAKCSSQCVAQLCWGPSSRSCHTCNNFKAGQQCVDKCEDKHGYYSVSNSSTCLKCHPECNSGCTGPLSTDCSNRCRHFQYGKSCEKECPRNTYKNLSSAQCVNCHIGCYSNSESPYCSGPSNLLSEHGCSTCRVFLESISGKLSTQCISREHCLGIRSVQHSVVLRRRKVSTKEAITLKWLHFCVPCHSQCRSHYGCNGNGPGDCNRCKHVSLGGKCLVRCPKEYSYQINGRKCLPCHSQCLGGCSGGSAAACEACRSWRLVDHQNNFVLCASNCTDGSITNGTKLICMTNLPQYFLQFKPRQPISTWHLILTCLSVVMAVCIVLYFVVKTKCVPFRFVWNKKAPVTFTRLIHTAPHRNIKPNMASLNIINVDAIAVMKHIGGGHYGSVHEAVWKTGDGCSVLVAVKQLKLQSSSQMLEEARIMASVEHDHCVKLIGICVADDVLLISQLLTYGSILQFYETMELANIDTQTCLLWGKQIACGMKFLSEKGIVHRDLAARNVLVEDEYHVRIADFGLAKFVQSGSEAQGEEYLQFAFKWTAPEVFENREFNSCTDVWSYGITLWEILTFGEMPYAEMTEISQLTTFLSSGYRLSCPRVAGYDIYELMQECWSATALNRPSFDYLQIKMSQFLNNPGEYVKNIDSEEESELRNFQPRCGNVNDYEEVIDLCEYIRRSEENRCEVDVTYR